MSVNAEGNVDSIYKEGYGKAVELLYRCSVEDGFLASPTKKANYRRIWSRDGAILGLAALMTGEEELIRTAQRTLTTLASYQGPHGEIPSNVDSTRSRVSYGGMAGRVDANLWFIIGCGEYWKATGDDQFIDEMIPVLEKVLFLLGAWEFNNRGLLYVPETGDWADEYIHNGYVLYDQLLYLQAIRTLNAIRKIQHGADRRNLSEKGVRLKDLIRSNYWFVNGNGVPDGVYHEILYKKGRKAATRCAAHFWVPFFTPHGYGYRFDSFANILASLFDVADSDQCKSVDRYIHNVIMSDGTQLLPAFSPVIEPVDRDWEDLNMTFSYTFKNKPYEYHNGGLWPMISGFYVVDLARRGKQQQAEELLQRIHEANSLEMEGELWGFPEYIHGEKGTAGGTHNQGWSAAAAIIGSKALDGELLLRIGDHDE